MTRIHGIIPGSSEVPMDFTAPGITFPSYAIPGIYEESSTDDTLRQDVSVIGGTVTNEFASKQYREMLVDNCGYPYTV